jgi:hypothetical protein
MIQDYAGSNMGTQMPQFSKYLWTVCAFALCLAASCDLEDRPAQPASISSQEIQVAASTATPRAPQSLHRAYVIAEDINTARQEIECVGGRIHHIIPRDGVLIGLIPTNINLKHSVIHELSTLGMYTDINDIWSYPEQQIVVGGEDENGPLTNCVVEEESDCLNKLQYTPKSLPVGAIPTDTSLYMIGDISVSVLLPESIGGSEDWTPAEILAVYSEILCAMDWYIQREPAAHLTFIYDYEVVPVSSEPIENTRGYRVYWINEMMDYLGFGVPGDMIPITPMIYDYVNYQRDMKNTDWGFAIFVVDSSSDPDGLFSGGHAAFAIGSQQGGGPYLVMTFDNGGYGYQNMDTVCAHEAGHIFGAADQYFGCSPTTTRGYLYIENQNCVNGGIIDEPSIMKNPLSAYGPGLIDEYARGQIGWLNSDGDGILDILDVEPKVHIHSCAEAGGQLSCLGTATSGFFPTLNPNYNDASINQLNSVLYRLTGDDVVAEWLHIDPGFFPIDELLYSFKFKIPFKHDLDVMAVDRFGVKTTEDNYGHISYDYEYDEMDVLRHK